MDGQALDTPAKVSYDDYRRRLLVVRSWPVAPSSQRSMQPVLDELQSSMRHAVDGARKSGVKTAFAATGVLEGDKLDAPVVAVKLTVSIRPVDGKFDTGLVALVVGDYAPGGMAKQLADRIIETVIKKI